MSREATSCDLWDCSFNKYLLSTYYMPVTVLGVSDTSMNKFLQKVHDLWSIYMLAGVRNWYIIDIPTEKAMAPHSSTLAWKIPWTEEPGRLQSMRSLSWAWLNDFTFTFHSRALEKEMATHSSVLAWRIPGMRKPGGRPSMGPHRVGHDWSDLTAAAAAFEKLVLFYLSFDLTNLLLLLFKW